MSSSAPKTMSLKRFVRLDLSKKDPKEVLSTNETFLASFPFLAEILAAEKSGNLLPTMTIQVCQNLLFQHMVETEMQDAKAKIAKSIELHKKQIARKAQREAEGDEVSDEEGPSKNYLITLMVKQYNLSDQLIGEEMGVLRRTKFREVENESGEIVSEKYIESKPAQWGADLYSEAEGIAHRALVANENSVYAIIENTIGKVVKTKIDRSSAFAQLFRSKKGAVMKSKPQSTPKLNFGVKAKNDRSVGPWSFYR